MPSGFDAEKFSRLEKSGDLAAAVAENLEGSNRAIDHFVEMFCCLPFAENFSILRMLYRHGCKQFPVEAVALLTVDALEPDFKF